MNNEKINMFDTIGTILVLMLLSLLIYFTFSNKEPFTPLKNPSEPMGEEYQYF